jgi:hypothetical protein
LRLTVCRASAAVAIVFWNSVTPGSTTLLPLASRITDSVKVSLNGDVKTFNCKGLGITSA